MGIGKVQVKKKRSSVASAESDSEPLLSSEDEDFKGFPEDEPYKLTEVAAARLENCADFHVEKPDGSCVDKIGPVSVDMENMKAPCAKVVIEALVRHTEDMDEAIEELTAKPKTP